MADRRRLPRRPLRGLRRGAGALALSGFEPERFVGACRAALSERSPSLAVRELVERAIRKPSAILGALGEPSHAGVQALHTADDLTVLNVVWAPRMTLLPHNHEMWAVIGVYAGREDNIFWRRLPHAPDGRVEAAGARSLGAGDVVPLGRDIIHSVTNPVPRCTAALHVYGGDFFATPRSEWDPETLLERPYDVEANMRLLAEADAS